MGIERKRIAILIAIFAIAAVWARAAAERRSLQVPLPDWDTVSYDFEGWHGEDAVFDPVYGEDPAQTSLLKVYHREKDETVIVYVAFYGDLAKILEMHTPERCYSGQGWQVLSTSDSPGGTFRGKPIPAKQMIVEKDGKRRLVEWWYLAGSRPFKDRIRYVYAMLAMSTLTGRNDGALVRFETLLEAGQEAVADRRMGDFRKSFQPQLERALPK
jgi:EpsI family protein